MGLKLGLQDPEQWLEDVPDRVYDNWYSFYQLEPFGGETELLTRVLSLLYVLCMRQGIKLQDVNAISEDFMQVLMPSDWHVERDPLASFDPDAVKDNLAKMGQALAKVFQ